MGWVLVAILNAIIPNSDRSILPLLILILVIFVPSEYWHVSTSRRYSLLQRSFAVYFHLGLGRSSGPPAAVPSAPYGFDFRSYKLRGLNVTWYADTTCKSHQKNFNLHSSEFPQLFYADKGSRASPISAQSPPVTSHTTDAAIYHRTVVNCKQVG